jgi:hypothetical protein
MLDFLKAILEIVAKVVPTSLAARNKRKLNDLGVELFILYAQVAEAMIYAEDIIRSVEIYIECIEHKLKTGGDRFPIDLEQQSDIDFKLQAQRANLAKIGDTIDRWILYLNIIDSESLARLMPLLLEKCSVLNSLLWIMGQGRIPVIGPSGSDIDRVAAASFQAGLESSRILEGIRTQVDSVAIPIQTPWDENKYRSTVQTLRNYNSRQAVEEIRAVLAQLRSSLENNFSLADVLPRVGDRRFRSTYSGARFI